MKGEEVEEDGVDLDCEFSVQEMSVQGPDEFIAQRADLVGDKIIPPIWCFFIGSSSLNSFSTTGIIKARVFPLPVTACAVRLFSNDLL